MKMLQLKSISKILQKSCVVIFGMGIVVFCGFISLNSLLDVCFDENQYHQIILLYFAMNLSFFTLVPVLVSHIQTVLCNKSRIPIYHHAVDYQKMLTDDYCKGFLPWCAILIVCTILYILFPCELFFWGISAFEISILVINTVFGIVVLQSSWTKDVSVNLKKQDK